jgi:hypothetical protein
MPIGLKEDVQFRTATSFVVQWDAPNNGALGVSYNLQLTFNNDIGVA